MNAIELFLESFEQTDEYLEEGFFEMSPIVAALSFKDKALETLFGKPLAKIESAKAKVGMKSGKGENATVYSFTKEQKKVINEIRKKYGNELIKEIKDFRNNVIAPYQIIKRNVANNSRITDKERHGMTKEEYFRYRESGRRKIEKRKEYNSNWSSKYGSAVSSREAYEKAKKTYEDFKNGKNVDISATITDKVLDKIGLGSSSLNNWPKEELDKTFNRIKELETNIKNSDSNSDVINVGTKKKVQNRSRASIEHEIDRLREYGYSHVQNIKDDDKKEDKIKRGSFKTAFINYCLRRDKIKELKNSVENSKYRKFYLEVLKSALDSAETRNTEEHDKLLNSRGSIDFNEYEEKIWGFRKTSINKMSGDIDDWYLKIKEEDFKGTEYIDKPESVKKAEAEIDAAVKRFERKISKIVEPEDLDKLKKYRLINKPITVKELKDPGSLFRNTSELKASKIEHEETMSEDEFFDILASCYNKKYSSFKELDDAKAKLHDARLKINSSTDEKYRVAIDVFLRKRNLKKEVIPGHSEIKGEQKEISIADVRNLYNRFIVKDYYSKAEADADKSKFEDAIKELRNSGASDTDVNTALGLQVKINNKLNEVE